MKKTFLLLLLSLNLTSQIKSDVKHFYGSLALTYIGCETSNAIFKKENLSRDMLIGFLFSNSIGLSKEFIHDRYFNKGVFSINDIIINSLGTGTGLFLYRVKIDLRDKKQEKINTKLILHKQILS